MPLVTPGRITVGIADAALTADPEATLITYALGSCIGVTIFDPVARVGGMLHFMLPQSTLNPTKAVKAPCMFADSGVPLLFTRAYELGAKKERLIVCAAGGAEILADEGHFKIGSRNRTMLRKLFWKNSVLLAAEDTGGTHSRTMTLRMSDGGVTVKNKNEERTLWPA
ncbi:MAG TPA: chemotaxis protein CheD [Phycisphaerales bacterium]|nr:chemotaxis protein CheD [Phycisphaerales bacterium]